MAPGSSKLVLSGQNSWWIVDLAARNHSATIRGARLFEYRWSDMMRMHPFSVIGQVAQPYSMFSLIQLRTAVW